MFSFHSILYYLTHKYCCPLLSVKGSVPGTSVDTKIGRYLNLLIWGQVTHQTKTSSGPRMPIIGQKNSYFWFLEENGVMFFKP